MQHLGEIFVDALSSMGNSPRRYAKRMALKCDIRALKKKRFQHRSRMGDRLVQLKNAGLSDFTRDDVLQKMLAESEKIDRVIASLVTKRAAMRGGNKEAAAIYRDYRNYQGPDQSDPPLCGTPACP
jgi:hypothetical protein